MIQRIKDYLHEKRISRLQSILSSAKTYDEKKVAWLNYATAINARSKDQILRMEQKFMGDRAL